MKNVSLLAIGGILGAMTIMGDASAKIVSRGFLDEALENYATTTALDLKANQSDFTVLSNKIGDWSIKNQTLSWSNIPYLSEFFPHLPTNGNWTVVSIADMLGSFYIDTPEAPTIMGAIMRLLVGWTNAEQKTYLGVKGLNDKIGTLPGEYSTVGAALTAIKGIAEEAKAAALAAIPDPKAEGSSGKYVLTVDIIGDNATYRWEKIDRSESESITTE